MNKNSPKFPDGSRNEFQRGTLKTKRCNTCDGVGNIAPSIECPTCGGTGVTLIGPIVYDRTQG